MSPIDNQTLCQIISDPEKHMIGESLSAEDWKALARKAHVEGVGPLLYWKLSRSKSISLLPGETCNFLRILYAGTRLQNRVIFKELKTLSQLFRQAGIAVVVLKGACFALTVYPDLGLRPMGDVDLLVPKDKLAEAVKIARSQGYEIAKPEASSGLRDMLNHEICLYKPGQPSMTLELHHSLVADKIFTYAVPVEWFWEQTEPFKPLSSDMHFEHLLMLKPEAQILYAAGHAMLQHGGENTLLRWFYDLDLLIRHYRDRLDWDLILTQAQIFEWGTALAAALGQTNAYFGTPIPEQVLATLFGSSDRHQKLVTLKQTHPTTHILLERHRLLSLNLYGRIRLILGLLVPSPAYMRWRYRLETSWSLLFYYPLRWLGIFKDALRTLIVLIRKDRLQIDN